MESRGVFYGVFYGGSVRGHAISAPQGRPQSCHAFRLSPGP